MGGVRRPTMKTVYSKNTIDIPKDCTVTIKSRTVQVTGPRGSLTKSFKHVSIDLYKIGDDKIKVEKWFGKSKELAIIKTVSSHIPTNVQINGKGDQLDVVNFIGQKVKFHVDALDGVKMERDPKTTMRFSFLEMMSRMCL